MTEDGYEEFRDRVEALLAKWQAVYDAKGVKSASPLYDRIMAEDQVLTEMRAEANDGKE